MKALPLWQPWATLVAIGAKRVETRRFPPGRMGLHPGQRIAIYATLTFGDAGVAGYIDATTDPYIAAALLDAGVPIESDAIPRGVIVATCTLKRASEMTVESIVELRNRNPREAAFGLYAPGRWAWVLSDVQRIEPPAVPPPGGSRQGTFDWEPGRRPVEQPAPPAQGSLL